MNDAKQTRPTTLWLATVASLLASAYAFMHSVYYAWMSALDTGTPERASLFAYGALAASAIFLFLFLYLAYRLRRRYAARHE